MSEVEIDIKEVEICKKILINSGSSLILNIKQLEESIKNNPVWKDRKYKNFVKKS